MNVTNGNVELMYTTKTGAELNGNVLCWSTPYTDYYISLEKHTDIWSNVNTMIEGVSIDEVLLSDADGFVNTQTIYESEKTNTMFKNSVETTVFGKGVKGYIPSYIELSILSSDLPQINEYLLANGKNTIDISNCWVSEMYDTENAWTSDGVHKAKNENANYYIFGRRIML